MEMVGSRAVKALEDESLSPPSGKLWGKSSNSGRQLMYERRKRDET